jgi:hypothetical protein
MDVAGKDAFRKGEDLASEGYSVLKSMHGCDIDAKRMCRQLREDRLVDTNIS